ncbi:hypothetical protein ACHQM5_030890 [Ranunculus cassubicifolius]
MSSQKHSHLLLQSKSASQFNALTLTMSDDDDDFQNPIQSIFLTQTPHHRRSIKKPIKLPLKPSNGGTQLKKPKRIACKGKENVAEKSSNLGKLGIVREEIAVDLESVNDCFEDVVCSQFKVRDSGISSLSSEIVLSEGLLCENDEGNEFELDENRNFSSIELQSLEPITDCLVEKDFYECNEKVGVKFKSGYASNSIESRLLAGRMNNNNINGEDRFVDSEPGTQLEDLIRLCSEGGDDDCQIEADFPEGDGSVDGLVECPLCGSDISNLSEESRHLHTNECLDQSEPGKIDLPGDDKKPVSPQQVADVSPVLDWLHGLGLSKYEEIFVKEEVDWDALQWLTEEDLFSIGITALGPRKKIIHALNELRKGNTHDDHGNAGAAKVSNAESKKQPGNKLITEFFPGSSVVNRNRNCSNEANNQEMDRSTVCPRLSEKHVSKERDGGSSRKRGTNRSAMRKEKSKEIPPWCCIPGTPFRVDAFRYSKGGCSDWFLTHFHIDHYQGLTKSFCHGKIYCSSITAQLVNMKIGISWDKLQVLPLNQKITIAGIEVTCLDANHCPGAIIILFEPPNAKAVLHTGDFRFSEEMTKIPALQSCRIQTLILDTTYCNPQYDFPKQEDIIQFVIESIQAETFNPKTLFLIGSYTIGKERLFIEVARTLQKKVYVGAAKLHTLKCLELPEEDMKWFTKNENESHIHVVPLWTIASFKRMKHIANQYLGRFTTIVAFSPTGWTFGKGRKKAQGRRSQQGTVIRYEVPYSEHSSFTELRDFVRFISPEKIIPSVNNDGPECVDAMLSILMS